jgi:hypothetical protein
MDGETDRAREELKDDLARIRSLPNAGRGCPLSELNEVLDLAALGRWPAGEWTPTRLPSHPPRGRAEARSLERCLSELTARRVGWPPSLGDPAPLIPADLPPEAWADRVVRAIEADASKLGLDRSRAPVVGHWMRYSFAFVLSRQRRLGRFDEARLMTDRVLALGRLFSRAYPDHPYAAMLMSECYVQRAKMSHCVDDRSALDWERRALHEAVRALALDPENEEARDLVKERRARVSHVEQEK